jgi:hypothetical protein
MDEAVKNALGVDICVGHVFMGRVGTRGVKDGFYVVEQRPNDAPYTLIRHLCVPHPEGRQMCGTYPN